MIFRNPRFFCRLTMAVLFCVCLSCSPNLTRLPLVIQTARGEEVALTVEVARTAVEQEKGFMGRKKIPDGTGMIFVYQSDRRMSFWMKNTPHPLSIAFIDSSGIIREIRDMKPFSVEPIMSDRMLRYALEVPQGWFTRAGVGIGDRLSRESLSRLTSP